MVTVRRAAGALAALGTACVGYGALVERHWFRVREERLPGALRRAGQPLRILFVSDTHLSPPDPELTDFVASLADVDADVVVAGGDLMGDFGAEDATIDLLAPLARAGRTAIAILGSNDLYGPRPKSPHVYFLRPEARQYGRRHDTDRLRAGLRATGWTVLENERATFETARGVIEVAGLVDPHLRRIRLPDPVEIRARDPAAILRLGLVHAPYRRALDLLVGSGYDVVLAGHTHGGQVRFPLIGAVVTNSDLPTAMARGTSRWAGSYLHVSAGLGQSKYAPFRFGCRPEASLLHLS